MEARIDDFDREEAYRIYVTRSLQLAPQNGYIQASYYDILHDRVDTRKGDEIALDIISRAGLNFGE